MWSGQDMDLSRSSGDYLERQLNEISIFELSLFVL